MPAITTRVGRSALLLAVASAVAAILVGFGNRTAWWHFRTGSQMLTWAAYGGLADATQTECGRVDILRRCGCRRAMMLVQKMRR
jgi:hypothetical protein